MTDSTFNGPDLLASALRIAPSVTLSFYPFGVILRRQTPDGAWTEYPVNPSQIAQALAEKAQFDTGILSGNTICVKVEGVQRLVAAYRPPQRTALMIEGSAEPFRVPMPGLIMIRLLSGGTSANYWVFAVKKRTLTADTALFHAPVPNVYGEGSVCWGSVPRVSSTAMAANDLVEDWALFFGSVFTPHSANGKSKSEPNDIRRKLAGLDAAKAARYPIFDLMPHNAKLGEMLNKCIGGH